MNRKRAFMRSPNTFAILIAACGMTLICGSTAKGAGETEQMKSYGKETVKSKTTKATHKKATHKASHQNKHEEEEEKWYSWFWPLGDKVGVHKLKDEYVPFVTEKSVTRSVDEALTRPSPSGRPSRGPSSNLFSTSDPSKRRGFQANTGKADERIRLLPTRPALAIESGNGFLDTGNLDSGFEVPIIGAVWQPRLWAYLINRTAFQTFDNGISGNPRETEIANRLDIFFNLQLTGTEKILLGLRPVDDNEPREFTRYTFDGRDEGFNEFFNVGLETLFFEGDLGSLFPVLDKAGLFPLDFGFTVGRQPLVFQEGILINDTIDAVGLIRNNIPFPGTSNFRVSAMWGWNRLDRNDRGRNADRTNMYGLFVAADTQTSTLNLDTIYVDDSDNASGFYIGASAIQRMPLWGGISTAFRVNASFALEDKIPAEVGGGSVVGDGVLFTAELSKTVPGSDDIVYFNSFLGIDNYTQAGREAIVGGPLANTGILFASPNLSTYGAEINPFTGNSVIGGAIGYQAFWDNKRRNLILEVAGRHDLSGEGEDSLGLGFQLQQAVGRYVQLTFEGFYTFNEISDDGAGLRAELQVVY